MRIALVGYGKMGKAIEQIALNKGHDIVLRAGIENPEELTIENLQKADVAIEFTGPESAFPHLQLCFEAGIPVVCGSTGWLRHYDEAKNICAEKNGGLLYASNFSLGVNLFFELNKRLAELMAPYTQYKVSMTEIHHTAKLDAPSGTAITLAEQIIEKVPQLSGWAISEDANATQLSIESKRIDPAPGTHTIRYVSEIDTITIEHEAHSRQGFAAGAVMAAEFLAGKKGVFSMKDVLKLKAEG
jgi:4-hydroxy-tetrahydrodipicolinate reductase